MTEQPESVEGRIGGVYRPSDTAMQKLLDESYELAWIDAVLLVDGEEVEPLDAPDFSCNPQGDIDDTAVVLMCAPYERSKVQGTLTVFGTGLLTVDDEAFDPRVFGVYLAEYTDTSEARAAMEQIMQTTGDSAAAMSKWAAMTGDPDVARRVTREMEEGQ